MCLKWYHNKFNWTNLANGLRLDRVNAYQRSISSVDVDVNVDVAKTDKNVATLVTSLDALTKSIKIRHEVKS